MQVIIQEVFTLFQQQQKMLWLLSHIPWYSDTLGFPSYPASDPDNVILTPTEEVMGK
jgi:hypothetical protein